ncbi:MAG: MATE family efflux transporter [Gammaproteobacteria bacterium]|nr:MATE family efflux transporter [Gammaproteobacteria bacterium]
MKYFVPALFDSFNRSAFWLELKNVKRLAIPIITGGIVNAVIPFMNTAFIGHLGGDALAAGGLVNSFFVFIMVLFWGVFSTTSSLIARYEGQKNSQASSELIKTGVVLAIILSIPVVIFLHYADRVLLYFGEPEQVVIMAHAYFRTLSFAILPDFLLTILYDLCLGLSKPRLVMLMATILIPLNLAFNNLFIFGRCGAPKLGISGVGVGASVSFWVVLFFMASLMYMMPRFRFYFKGRQWFYPERAKELLRVGLPVGAMWVLEVGFYAVVTLFMGRVGIIALAAHQMAFQTYMVLFNIIYNFSQAVSIRVADGMGTQKPDQIRYAYLSGLLFCLLTSLLLLFFVTLGGKIILHFYLGAEYARQPELVKLALSLFLLTPLFCLFDSLGFMTFASLRAMKDTRYTMLVALVVYWFIIIPLIAFGVDVLHWQNPRLLWMMMIIGAGLSFAAQSRRFIKKYRIG